MARNSRIVGSAVLVVVLWAGSAAGQEPPKADAFAGVGLYFIEHGAVVGPQVGGGVWVTQGLRVGGVLYSGGLFGLLSTHWRLPMGDNTDLLMGTTPVWFWPGDGVSVSPAVEAFVSQRVSPIFRMEVGTSFDITDKGGYVQVLGRVTYSFD